MIITALCALCNANMTWEMEGREGRVVKPNNLQIGHSAAMKDFICLEINICVVSTE